ncbi:MAG: quinoprotein dehydrogenase-associated putative ABC transporter substrate-binding protein [Gammaproteobacteria bacterium]
MKIINFVLLLLFILSQSAFAEDAEMPDKKYLKVCADPYMLPMSNHKEEGYENKIAELLAEKLGLKLKYEFFPQRMGFIRNTLRAESEDTPGYKCDLVINVPSNFELAATTEPYYTTTYVLVYAKGRKLDAVTEAEMLTKVVEENNIKVKIGVTDRGPAQLWVFYQNLMGYMVPYQGHPGNVKVDPGHVLVKDIVDGKIDAAVVWGPTAGYYAKKYKDKAELMLLPVKDDVKKNREMRFAFSNSMAVRYGEKAWKEKINKIIKENQTEIEKILIDYGVPLVK